MIISILSMGTPQHDTLPECRQQRIPDLTSQDIKAIFENMDVYLNQILLKAFLDVSLKRFQAERRKILMVLAIIFLYVLDIISLSVRWWLVNNAFIKNGWNFWEVFLGLQNMGSSFLQILLTAEISGIVATMIADAIMVMYIYHYVEDFVSLQATTSYNGYTVWVILYLSFVLSTTILSTVLIIYRIIKVVLRTERGRAGIQSHRGAIEILVESAFL
ncbi:hypothetical protein ARMGADRAFT_1029348 [Armillaria gallica]|uniref:Uncharacterized protein n=1 Tax=Armillaria gallica TaxID=47427 RepID=A0A2H3DG39_ARMGA|nr:hypothetical protein ARMGADRAFT_1029348 [Armillaria gallica]